MTRQLRVSPALSIPAERAVTQTFGILGMRGSGKSNTTVVMAEEMWKAKLPWVAVDPKGDWWGIRSNTDGTGPGLALPVLGGLHGDVPLESAAGVLVADLIVDENLTCVLDVSDFSKTERARFLVDFFDRLYRRHRKAPEPRHIFLEEAHEYIPQQVSRVDARLKDSASRIPLQGRSFGLGSSVISQRSARLHKDVLTQTGTMIVLRTPAPQDRKAILGWVEEHGQSKELIDSLPGLKDGEAWVWSPEFLKVIQRVRFRRRETFDSGSTPTIRGKRKNATIADIDISILQSKMAETIEKQKAEDPKFLQQRVRELERELAKARLVERLVETKIERVEVPVLPSDQTESLHAAISDLRDAGKNIMDRVTEESNRLVAALAKVNSPEKFYPTKAYVNAESQRQIAATSRSVAALVSPESGGPLGKGARIILSAIAQHNPVGVTRDQLSVMTGYKRATRDAYLQRLRAAGYVQPASPGSVYVTATDEGIAWLGSDYEPLPTGAALRAYWLERLPEGEAKILSFLCEHYPNSVDRLVIDKAVDYKRATRDAYIQRLKARRLIEVVLPGIVRAAKELF